MAIKVFIQNFENIADAKIVLDGLVALVGESNNGKTATYNALKVLTYNIQGRNYIRRINDKEIVGGARVGVMFEEEQASVVFEKADAPVYKLQTPKGSLLLDKAGRGGTPEDAAILLNMIPLDLDGLSVNLNFVDQLSEPLLKKLSDYQMYKIAVKSFDGEKIQEAIALCKKDWDEKKLELKLKSAEIEVQKKSRLAIIEQLDVFKPIVDVRAEFHQYDNDCRQVAPLLDFNNRRNAIQNEITVLVQDIKKLEGIGAINAELIQMQKEAASITVLEGFNNRRNYLVQEIAVLNQELTKYKVLDDINIPYREYVADLRLVKDLLDMHGERSNIQADLKFIDEKLAILGDPLTSLTSGLSTYKEDVKVLDTVSKLSQKRGSLVSDISTIETTLEMLVDLPDITQYRKDIVEKQKLDNFSIRRESLVSETTLLGTQLSDLETEIKELQYMVDNDICPTCGNKCDCKTEK
jgi:hypothetical protein